MIGEHVSLQEFLRGFSEFTKDIPLKTVRPALSTVAYKTNSSSWTPENIKKSIPAYKSCDRIYQTVNQKESTAVVIAARRVPVEWTKVEMLYSYVWELYVLVWLPEQKLLFINSSENAGEYKELAQSVAGESASLIR
jgi:hypothetical protein